MLQPQPQGLGVTVALPGVVLQSQLVYDGQHLLHPLHPPQQVTGQVEPLQPVQAREGSNIEMFYLRVAEVELDQLGEGGEGSSRHHS